MARGSASEYAIEYLRKQGRNLAASTAYGGTSATETTPHEIDGDSHRDVTGALILHAVISPPELTADVDDWAPEDADTAEVIRITTDASRRITGIAAPVAGWSYWLVNVGANDVVLGDEDAASAAANRFACPAASDVTLGAGAVGLIAYDVTSTRWRVLAAGEGGTTSPLTTKGDLFGFDTADARIPVGADEADLIADSSDAQGVVWRPNRVTTTDPAVTDDSGDGYRAGSRWLNVSSAEEFVCLDATVGAAVWKSTTSSSGVSDILDLPTAETDTSLVLAPDGAGGVEFRPETGGSGGADANHPMPLDSYAINGTYGDDFTGAALAAIWTRRNFTSGAETYQLPPKQTHMRIAMTGRAIGDGYFQTAPAGDWTFMMACVPRGFSGANSSQMGWGIAVVNSVGTGVATTFYSSPICFAVTNITTYSTYGGSSQTITLLAGLVNQHRPVWQYLRKSGTNYYGAYSFDGETWSPETAAFSSAITVDRIGMLYHPLCTMITTAHVDVDTFNKIA